MAARKNEEPSRPPMPQPEYPAIATFVDKAHLELDRAKGNAKALDPASWIAFRHFVPEQADALRLELADDGRGCDLTRAGTGFGLHGIRERAQSFGGSADIDSTPGHGLRIRVRLPLADGAE